MKPNDIATDLGVKAPSVTGMLKRLGDGGLDRVQPGTGREADGRGRRRGPPASSAGTAWSSCS